MRALRTIRYGSITLTVHDGRLVEIHKTERMRRKIPMQKEYNPPPAGDGIARSQPTHQSSGSLQPKGFATLPRLWENSS